MNRICWSRLCAAALLCAGCGPANNENNKQIQAKDASPAIQAEPVAQQKPAPEPLSEISEKNIVDLLGRYYAVKVPAVGRAEFILDAEKWRPVMKKWYEGQTQVPGKIEVSGIQRHPTMNGVFFVDAGWVPDAGQLRRPSARFIVRQTKDGLKVDWPSSVGYNEPPLKVWMANPSGRVPLRVMADVSAHYLGDYRNSRDSHYSIRIIEEWPQFSYANVFILKSSKDGARLFSLLKDGHRHRVVLEIDFSGPNGEMPRTGAREFAATRLISDSWIMP